jgi:trehalose/maltose transport system substrate-binding protein
MEDLGTAVPLVRYIGVLVLFLLASLWALEGHNSKIEPKFAALSALVALLLALNFNVATIDYLLSGALVLITALLITQTIRDKQDYVQSWRQHWPVWATITLVGLATLATFWFYYQNDLRDVSLKAMLATETNFETLDKRRSAEWEQGIAERFKEKTGATVTIIPAPSDTTQRLNAYLQQLSAPQQIDNWRKDAVNDVDVYAIDAISIGTISPYVVDLTPYFKRELRQQAFIPSIIANNMIEGKLLSIPWYADSGLLFYRKDLLKQYDIPEPPKSWRNLETAASRIQQGERQKNPYFWGYIWQGKEYEGLTCNALEWQASNGNPTLVNSKGEITVNNPQTIAAFEQARKWINTISPPSSITYDEGQTFETWMDGNAAFMRNWPYAYIASQEAGWAEGDNVGVAPLPKGDDSEASNVGVLGGWQLAVNAASRGKEKQAALKFVQFLTRQDTQKDLAIKTGKLPTREALYDDQSMLKQLDYPRNLDLRAIIKNAVSRTANLQSEIYPSISQAYFEEVHKILIGEKKAETAVKDIEKKLQNIYAK